jgi:GrpB-like predicted nucleotidyltransferase (UPF0157 family)
MIEIVDYRPTWPAEFSAIGNILRHHLASLALRIDHIGSTAVPGLAAKDIIDIQITAAALEAPIEQAINRAGYKRLEHIVRDHVPPGASNNDQEWSKWFFKSAADQRPVNIHVRLAGRANQRYPLLFRDYLRAHSSTAQAYAQVKTELSKRHANDMDAYYDIKDPVCDIIMSGAEAWARLIGWEPGPSDC